jgi:hypothetical protein
MSELGLKNQEWEAKYNAQQERLKNLDQQHGTILS